MRRVLGYSVIGGLTVGVSYTYYKHIYKKEPSPLLGKILSRYLSSPSLKMHIPAASFQYNKKDGLLLVLSKAELKRGEEFKRVNNSDNYTRFDVTVDSIGAHLDLKRWLLERRHPVYRCELEGVRGTVDRTHLQMAPGWRMHYAKEEISLDQGLVARDVLLAVRNALDAPAFPLSIYSAVVPRLRWSWLLHDILNASSIIGSYDNSLFSYQPPQLADFPQQASTSTRHLRVDSLPIEHINRGVQQGPLSWIQRGRVAIDISVQLPAMLPSMRPESNMKRLFRTFNYDDDSLVGFIDAIKYNESGDSDDTPKAASSKSVDMRVNLRLTGIKAQVPLLTSDISLMNQALVRPVVSYLNEHRHHTVSLSFAFSVSIPHDLRGSWGIHESGIADRLSIGVAESFTELATDKHRAGERARRVGLWSLYSMMRQFVS